MYECQNCGGNLKFDIDSQQLKCDYCLTVYDPYQVIKENDAVESEMFDATIFTCPQCGGEILSTDNSAAVAAHPHFFQAASADRCARLTLFLLNKTKMHAKKHI